MKKEKQKMPVIIAGILLALLIFCLLFVTIKVG
jgi:hypothetical protein